jgi:undecaprenyl-diphosphatase
MEFILDLDYQLMVLLNSLHTPLFDPVMLFFTAPLPWIPLYCAIAFAIFYKFGNKENCYRYASLVFVSAFVIFAITDMGSSAIKDLFMRLRPGHDPRLDGMIRLLDGKGGMYGFISSHASNVFGLATFTSLVFRRRWYSISIFFWASMVSYSRIYVGRHFPSDVLFGALFGFIAGYAIYRLIHTKFMTSLLKIKKTS